MNLSVQEFIDSSVEHTTRNGVPPIEPKNRHIWESMLLYSAKDKLKNDVKLIDYGCGNPGTLAITLLNRYPQSKYYGLDIMHSAENKDFDSQQKYIGHISNLEYIIDKVDCMIAGSVLTHLAWEDIVQLLNKCKPLFENGGEFGFSIFKGDSYNLYSKDPSASYYHVVELPIQYLENYCKDNNLKLKLLDFQFEIDHNIEYENKKFNKQYFCNISK